jgi:N-acetylglutamate synthase-like GNAT family acetyltransferase
MDKGEEEYFRIREKLGNSVDAFFATAKSTGFDKEYLLDDLNEIFQDYGYTITETKPVPKKKFKKV